VWVAWLGSMLSLVGPDTNLLRLIALYIEPGVCFGTESVESDRILDWSKLSDFHILDWCMFSRLIFYISSQAVDLGMV